MFKLNYVKPEDAQGKIKETYSIFPPEMGVPVPLQMYSVSPALIQTQIDSLKYFMHHPNLPFPLLAAIRVMSANELCYDYCADLNAGLLQKVGMSESEIESLLGDMSDVPFEENEVALLKLVQKVIKDPKSVSESDVQSCRDVGWTDSDIYDAAYHGCVLAIPSRLFSAFKS